MKIDKGKYSKGGVWFNAEKVEGQEARVTVKDVREQQFTDRTAVVLDLDYKKEVMGFPLNATNLERMIDKFGDESAGWVGKQITVYKVRVNNPRLNKEVDSLRIR